MLHQIIEIQSDKRYLSLNRGFLQIYAEKKLIAETPLDDIAVLLLSGNGISVSKNILTELSSLGAITIFCGKNYIPESILIPVNSNYLLNAVLNSQISATLPFKKNIWKLIVIEKLKNQAKVLKYFNIEKDALLVNKISCLVKSGDSDNREAYGARIYWKALFGKDFIRDYNGDGINALLNYSYAIIRASMIRALFAVGLQPALGIHHDNKLNAFCLADDFMEIYRPIADLVVKNLVENKIEELTPETKKILTNILWIKVKTIQGCSPVFQSMQYMASSYIKCLAKTETNFFIPEWEGTYERIPDTEQV